MKLFAPAYYTKFKCIADKCEHNCCTGWEIDVDEATLNKYESLTDGYGLAVKESISTDGTPHFKLGDNDRCPHLDEGGLCKIISHLGEEYLSDICRCHPRFFNFTDTAEVGVGMSCPEAARIILSSPDYNTFPLIGERDSEPDFTFDGRGERSKVYAILGEVGRTFSEKLQYVYKEYSIPKRSDSSAVELFSELEYLDESHKQMFMQYSSAHPSEEYDVYLERFLAYLVFRHCTEATDKDDFSARLGFCLLCTSLLCSMIRTERAESLSDVVWLAVIISEEIEYSDENTFLLTY